MWICHACTFKNDDIDNLRCSICETININDNKNEISEDEKDFSENNTNKNLRNNKIKNWSSSLIDLTNDNYIDNYEDKYNYLGTINNFDNNDDDNDDFIDDDNDSIDSFSYNNGTGLNNFYGESKIDRFPQFENFICIEDLPRSGSTRCAINFTSFAMDSSLSKSKKRTYEQRAEIRTKSKTKKTKTKSRRRSGGSNRKRKYKKN